MAGRSAPHETQARQWERALRRIDRVDVCACGTAPVATLHGVGHRRPVRRTVSVATAAELVLRGHPLHVCTPAPTPAPERRHEGERRGRLPQ